MGGVEYVQQPDIIETDTLSGVTTRRGNSVLVHTCFRCGKSAPFGYNVNLRRGKLGVWTCAEHRAELEVALKGEASVGETGEPGSNLGSGRLF